MIYNNATVIEGAGDSLAPDSTVLSPITYDDTHKTEVAAGNFLRLAKNKYAPGAVLYATGDKTARFSRQSDTALDAKGSILVFPQGLSIQNGENFTVKNAVIVGNITVTGTAALILENVKIKGTLTIAADCSDIVLNACRLESETCITSEGDGLILLSSALSFTVCGIRHTGQGLGLRNCRLTGTGTGIVCSGTDNDIRYSTLTLSEQDTGILFDSGACNSLSAMNRIEGVQVGLRAAGARNTSVVRNSMICVQGEGCRNLYIIDNELGGRAELTGNNYLIADGNTYPADTLTHTPKTENNQNTNGDTLMNVDARLEVGADVALLPHVDRNQFSGMVRKVLAGTPGGEHLTVSEYIRTEAEAGEYVFVMPGAYSTRTPLGLYEKHKNTTVYAYGVYLEMEENLNRYIFPNHLTVQDTENIAVKGVTLGYTNPSCGQVYVLEKRENNEVLVIPGAGMLPSFANSKDATYFNTNAMGYQRAGDFYALADTFSRGITQQNDGTMLMKVDAAIYDILSPGDLFTCRYKTGESTVHTQGSSGILYKDLTAYGIAVTTCFSERENTSAVTYYRAADTTAGGAVIDRGTYETYLSLSEEYGVDFEIYQDEWGNYRGSLPHISSIDASHVISCTVGSQMTSCLFENMCDDGTNQKSNHARLAGYEIHGDTVTITYKPNFQEVYKNQYGVGYSYSRVCPDFRVGDRVFIYTAGGALVCDGPALSVTETAGEIPSTVEGNNTKMTLRTVTVSAEHFNKETLSGYDLSDDYWYPERKVLVDNMSRASGNAKFDNMLIQNVRVRGLLIKCSGAVVQNCTFRNLAKLAVSCLYELYYGESGITEDITITRNLVDHVGFGLSENGLYYHYPIAVQGLGGDTVDEDHLLCKNIEISYNKYINMPQKPFTHKGDTDPHNYAVYLRAVQNVRIIGNDFSCLLIDEEDSDTALHGVRLQGAMNIEISGNTFSPYATFEGLYVSGEHYKHIYGTDVTEGETPLYPDRP